MAVLVGDVGGTNTRLAIFEDNRIVHRASFLNAEMTGFDVCLAQFLSAAPSVISAAVFGAAGPLEDGRIKMTQLDWLLDETALATQLKVPVRLLNDFHIQALGTLTLTAHDYEPLGSARVQDPQRMAVIGAGTGLGEALLVFRENRWLVIPGEGGHKRFAPKNDREIELLRILWQKFPEHVSVERIVSGPGVVNVYTALSGADPAHFGDEDPARVITEQALDGSCSFSKETLDIFVDTLADEAADLALQNQADCVYVSGGIPPRVIPIIRARFRHVFEAKGRYRSLLAQVEIRVVDRGDMALEGAAYAAKLLVGQTSVG